MWTPRRLAIAFLAGGACGLIGDYLFHVLPGVLWYPDTGLWGQPWWVGPQFGASLLLILTGGAPFASAAARRQAGPVPHDVLTAALWFAGAYAVTGALGHHPRALLAGMLVAFAGRLAVRRDRAPLLAWCLLVAAGGVAWEALISWLGLFYYSHPYADPSIAGVPIWLPAIYLHGAPLAFPVLRKMTARNTPVPK